METQRIGIRELKARLSAYLKNVKKGETIVITEHGQPVGKIIPVNQKIPEAITSLVESGLVQWSGKSLTSTQTGIKNKGDRQISDLLVEMRE